MRRRGPLAMILEHACITWSLDGDTLAAAIALLHHSAIYRRERAIAHMNTGAEHTTQAQAAVRATAVRAGPRANDASALGKFALGRHELNRKQ